MAIRNYLVFRHMCPWEWVGDEFLAVMLLHKSWTRFDEIQAKTHQANLLHDPTIVPLP
jgi:hypothetical protein